METRSKKKRLPRSDLESLYGFVLGLLHLSRRGGGFPQPPLLRLHLLFLIRLRVVVAYQVQEPVDKQELDLIFERP